MKEISPKIYAMADENVDSISNSDPIMNALLKIQAYAVGGADSLTAHAGDDIARACLERIKKCAEEVGLN